MPGSPLELTPLLVTPDKILSRLQCLQSHALNLTVFVVSLVSPFGASSGVIISCLKDYNHLQIGLLFFLSGYHVIISLKQNHFLTPFE